MQVSWTIILRPNLNLTINKMCILYIHHAHYSIHNAFAVHINYIYFMVCLCCKSSAKTVMLFIYFSIIYNRILYLSYLFMHAFLANNTSRVAMSYKYFFDLFPWDSHIMLVKLFFHQNSDHLIYLRPWLGFPVQFYCAVYHGK